MLRVRRWVAALSVTLACAVCANAHAQVEVDASAPSDAGVPPPVADLDAALETSAADAAEPVAIDLDAAPPPSAPVEPVVAVPLDTGLEEIVVTAQRRRTDLQKTPIAITALSSEELHERGAVDLQDVIEGVPNVQLITSSQASGGSNFAQLFIRGIGQTDFYITKDPAVGLYVDGVYLARAPGSLLQLLDIDRVEVLRGPQGTLFGKNTAGGAINVITKKPDGSFGGVADLQAGGQGRRGVAGSFQAPIIEDRLFMRVTGSALHQDGYYQRLEAGAIDSRTADGNSLGSYAGRVSLLWSPSDEVEVILAADASQERQTGTDYQAVAIFDDVPNIRLYNDLVLAPIGQRYDSSWVAPRPWATNSTTPSYDNTDVWGVSGTVSWGIGPVQLKSISAYRALRAAARTDADGTPFDIVASEGIEVKQHQISQELQLTGNSFDHHLAWVLGLWYFQEDAEDHQGSRQLVGLYEALEDAPPRSIAPPGQPADMCPADGSGPAETCLGGMGNPLNKRFDLSRDFARELSGRSYAAFGQASVGIGDALGFTVGARFSREEKDFSYEETQPLQADKSTFGKLTVKPAWNVFTPRLGVDYRFTRTLMVYASYAWGFKAGGITGRPARADLFQAMDPEWLITYEVGLKSEWFDRRLRVNLAAFYSQYTDIQITRNTTDAQGMFIRVEQNAGDGNIKGFEAEVTAVPVKGLSLGAAVGYTDFEFTSLLPQQSAQPNMLLTLQSQLPFTPKFTGAFFASYALDLGGAGELRPRVDVDYSTGYYVDIPNTEAIAQDNYVLLNARLAYAPASDAWELYVAATNLTDQAVIGSGVFGPANGSQVVSYRAPRIIYAGARFRFD
ncbi:MAG TPA: TonB-dependent receptor [Polyangiales bacterium]|nr:TonB-dependent receptor [Polyangiales bacterium]